MTRRDVTTQKQLDAALADPEVDRIVIGTSRTWLQLCGSHKATVEASGSATVEASGSATVWASGSATVWAWGSATVRAWGSVTVRASDSVTVEASGSVTVRASDSVTVEASGSVTVEAWDSATVEATPWVAIHQKSRLARITGGVVIDHTKFDLTDPALWCQYHGVEVDEAGIATLYKALNANWSTDRGTDYSPGATPEAPDWSTVAQCGGGLHFSPTPEQAACYLGGRPAHYVVVGVEVATLVPLDSDKCKAPRVVRPCVEVDRFARPILADGEPS